MHFYTNGKGSEIVNESETASETEASSELEKAYDLYVNGAAEMKEDFAKYDICFSIKVKAVE